MRKIFLLIILIVLIGLAAVFIKPSITGAVIYNSEQTLDGIEIDKSSITQLDATTWDININGKFTSWTKKIDNTLNIQAQTWDCQEDYLLAYKSFTTINKDGSFEINAKFKTPEQGKLRILLQGSGVSIDSGYNLNSGQLIRGWSNKLLQGIKDIPIC